MPGKIGGHRRQALAGEPGTWLVARLAEKPDLTMRALTAELAARGVHVAHDTVWRFVRRAGQTVKKRP
jgi:transposase